MQFFKLVMGVLALAVSICPSTAFAGYAKDWQFGFQDAATAVMRDIADFHNLLLVIITLITIFVLALLVYTMWRFSAKRNPVPSKTTHHTALEMMWTVVPVVILVVIAVPSFKLLYFSDVVPKADMTIKATGYQWYWSYQYPDHGNASFDANVVDLRDPDMSANDRKMWQAKFGDKYKRLLDTDNSLVVPVDTTIRLQITAGDVLHSWALPAFGVKKDAVPGRLNETWFKAEKLGTFYGQCSELCGARHGFMPIRVDVVSKRDFEKWVKKQQASIDAPTNRRLAKLNQ
ncbi:MAG: cytochrome c oxidase subunit II [Rhodospirillaceae bacterium]